MSLLLRLRSRLKSASAAFTDPELQEPLTPPFPTTALREGQDNRVILDPPWPSLIPRAATDTARHEIHPGRRNGGPVHDSWNDMDLYKLTWARIAEALPASAPTPAGLQPDTAVLARDDQTDAEASEA